MSVQIHIPTPMRQHTAGQATVQVGGSTIKAALADLGQKFPGISDRLFDNGQIRRFVNVYLNDEDIRYLENLDTAVKDGDEVSIIRGGWRVSGVLRAAANILRCSGD
jgi:molybdopterin converting factor small subunit